MRGDTAKLGLVAVCLFKAATFGSCAVAQSTNDLVGMWTLVSSITERDGKKSDQFGAGAQGMMSFDAGGRFMLTIIGPELPRFASGNRASGTPEENKAVVSKTIAMIGTYSVSATDKTVTFHVESATFPNWKGTAQKRTIVAASGDVLKYVTATASSGGVGTVTWKRAK